MRDLIEFYVSCNPPLLPKGVKYVLDQLKESKIECAEILYEPTAPWFQCSVSESQYKPLKNFLESLIYEILDQETGDFELDPLTGDIEIVADDPMILNWGAFLQLEKKGLDEYEQYRYPAPFRHFAFKTIWQELRSSDAPDWLNIKALLQREGDFDWSIKRFMEIVGCEVSYNVREDILYLGCNDMALIDKAAQRLDSLFKCRKHAARSPTQLILPPANSTEWKLCLRPISKFRLATSTIIQTNAVTAKDDYRDLYTKGIIITYVFEDRYGDEWGFPEYPVTGQALLPQKPFVDFANYLYPAKQATSRPSAPIPVAERTLPEAASHKIDAIVADWVRETGEGCGLCDEGFQSTSLRSRDGGHSNFGMSQLQEMISPAESTPFQEAQDTTFHNMLDEDEPHIARGQHVDAWSLKYGSVQQEDSQKCTEQVNLLGAKDGISAQGGGWSTNGSSLKTARASTLPLSSNALADLVGLSIPITEEARPSNVSVEHATPELHAFSTQFLTLDTSSNGRDSQRQSQNANQVKDLLGMDDEDALQNLMAPMVPTLTPQASFRGTSPRREYRQTMNQRAPRREWGRGQRHPNTTARLSPSPPPSSPQRKSKIPVKSGRPAPGTRDARSATTRANPSVAGDRRPGPTQNTPAARGSRLAGSWNTGLGGEEFDVFVLSPELKDSIKNRLYFEHALGDCLAGMLRRARTITGKVSIEVVFCRILIENVNKDVVNFGRVDEYHQSFAPLRFLNELALFKEGDFRWHGILSLNGNDANSLKEINWTSDPKRRWQLHDTEVFYDFSCEDLTSSCRFIIQVNATDFAYGFESQKFALEDLVFIHCPDRSWDLNAYVKATDTAYFEDKYGGFANSLIESLVVPDGLGCGNPHFSFHEHGQYRVSVERVRVRHVARYRDGDGGNTFLNITMWQATSMDWDAVEDSNRSTRHIRVEPSENDDTNGLANVWYEASISSARAEKVLQENTEIEFGDEAHWTETQLKDEGVFKDLYLPAIGMVEHMDQIGSGNDNGRNPFGGSVLPGAGTKVEELKEDLFW